MFGLDIEKNKGLRNRKKIHLLRTFDDLFWEGFFWQWSGPSMEPPPQKDNWLDSLFPVYMLGFLYLGFNQIKMTWIFLDSS